MERIAALLIVCSMLRSEGASDFSRGIDSGGDTVTDGDSAPVIADEVESGETIFEAVDFSQELAVPDFELGDRLLPGMVFFDDWLSSDSENLAQVAEHRASEFSSREVDQLRLARPSDDGGESDVISRGSSRKHGG